MLTSERLAFLEGRLRPLIRLMPTDLAIGLYSKGRVDFLQRFVTTPPHREITIPPSLARTLWGITFRLPIFNAAGMFKNGDAYDVVGKQGAGGYLAGTTTGRPRPGNDRYGVRQPFAPYPRSGAASNWLGLPNVGHRRVAERLRDLPRRAGCPVGVSLSADPAPDIEATAKLDALLQGLRLYREAAVDFVEINESCPNTEGEHTAQLDGLRQRLTVIAEEFLSLGAPGRERPPVVVKMSCDTALGDVDALVEMLLELGFDGINLGNTSVAYDRHRESLAASERRLFDRFRQRFGGGLSGRPLKDDSLRLGAQAVERAQSLGASNDFHVWRTGGVETAADIRRSLDAGIALCQWYTGYFEHFGRYGHRLYERLSKELTATNSHD